MMEFFGKSSFNLGLDSKNVDVSFDDVDKVGHHRIESRYKWKNLFGGPDFLLQ